MDYCINHTSERAVGHCGTCKRPACYRCSLTIDQVIYCSTTCFNERPAKVRVSSSAPAALVDEYSDVVSAFDGKMSAAERAAAAEPSVVLSAHMSDKPDTTMLGVGPVSASSSDGSTMILAGARRAILSSSCFFHPDTSAIVLCAKCRNPICTLCAKETPDGLLCSPSCGPRDLVGIRERRKLTMINFCLTVVALVVAVESGVLLAANKTAGESFTAARVERARPAAPTAEPPSADPEVRRADALVKEATTLIRDAADGAELGRKVGNDAPALTAWLGRAVAKLRQARELYASRAGNAPDPDLKRRIESVGALLDGLKVGNEPAPARTPSSVSR